MGIPLESHFNWLCAWDLVGKDLEKFCFMGENICQKEGRLTLVKLDLAYLFSSCLYL